MLIYNFKCIFYKQKYVSPYFFIKFAPVNKNIIKIHRCLNFFSYLCRNPFFSTQGIDANTKNYTQSEQSYMRLYTTTQ